MMANDAARQAMLTATAMGRTNSRMGVSLAGTGLLRPERPGMVQDAQRIWRQIMAEKISQPRRAEQTRETDETLQQKNAASPKRSGVLFDREIVEEEIFV